jgi:Transposase IS116/IS110/IS902 family
VILAEIGTVMTRFPTAGHLTSWGRLAPGIKESAGQKKGKSSTGHGNAYLAAVLGNAAAGAAKTDTFLGERYRRIARRRGSKRAIVATGRAILVIVWHLLSDPDARFHDLGPGYYDARIDPNAASATTSASLKPWATRSPSTRRITSHNLTRLRCAPPGAAACPLAHQFSDQQEVGWQRAARRLRWPPVCVLGTGR